MFFEILIFAWFLIKFDQNPVNHVKEIAGRRRGNEEDLRTEHHLFGKEKVSREVKEVRVDTTVQEKNILSLLTGSSRRR